MKSRSRTGSIGAVFLAAVLMVGGISGAQQEPVHDAPLWLGTEISLVPDEDGAGIWKCRAVLEDLAKEEVLSAPTIVFAGGEEARVQSGLPSGVVWELSVRVSEDGGVATWSSQVTLGEQLLSVNKGTLRLVGTPE